VSEAWTWIERGDGEHLWLVPAGTEARRDVAYRVVAEVDAHGITDEHKRLLAAAPELLAALKAMENADGGKCGCYDDDDRAACAWCQAGALIARVEGGRG